MKKVTFEKYHCMGNDYLVYDPNKKDVYKRQEQPGGDKTGRK